MKVNITLDTEVLEKLREIVKDNAEMQKCEKTISQYISKVLKEHIEKNMHKKEEI